MRILKRVLVAVTVVSAFTAASGTADASTTTRVVRPGQSIQAAVDASKAGDTVLVRPGTYHESVNIGGDGIRLVGFGATLAPPAAADPESPCAGNGFCVLGDVSDAGEVNSYRSNVSITGFRITGFDGLGIIGYGARNLTVEGNDLAGNGGYGVAAFTSTGTKYLFNSAHDSGEAGLYIGDSPNANATLVGNRSYNNQFGAFLRDSQHSTLAFNQFRDNCIGIIVLADAPGPAGNDNIVANLITHNTKACPASEDGPPLSGGGVAIVGGHDNRVTANVITDNAPSGDSIASGGVIVQAGRGGTEPVNNVVSVNLLRRNTPADLVSDGTGTGNVFSHNSCTSSLPPGSC